MQTYWEDLLSLDEAARQAILEAHRDGGVKLPCTDGVIIAAGVKIGAGTLILPGTILCGGTVIGRDCVIGPGSVLADTAVGEGASLNNVHSEDAVVGPGCEIGPWVRLRPGTALGGGLRVGNFVEIKNSTVGGGSKIAHLSYIGDARFGQRVNVGCGVAVANYDGRDKHETVVGDGAFIGCNNSLVAPVTLGPGAYTAAGSVITEDVPAGNLAIARARQVNKGSRRQE